MQCIVICRDRGKYELATRTVFEDETAAETYAATISTSRDPMVIPGDFTNLRFNEARGTTNFWLGGPR